MLKNKTKIIAILLILFVVLSSSFVFADEENSEHNNDIETTTTQALTEDNYKSSDVYLIDQNVTINYIVDGNLFVMADTVTINSEIGGDAFIIAKNVIVEKDGYIYNSLYTMADTVTVKGVAYDIYAVCSKLNIEGFIYRDIKIGCDTFILSGIINRNAFLDCNNIEFIKSDANSGIIGGNLEYSSKSELSIPENSVNGEINFTQITERQTNLVSKYLFDLGRFLSTLLIVWAICLWLTPKFLENTNQFVGKKTWKALAFGLLSPILVVAAFIVLLLLNLTSTVAIMLLYALIFALLISVSLFTITLNKFICTKLNINKNIGIFGMLIITGLVIWAILQIPYAGPVVGFISGLIGNGILVLSILPKRNPKHESTEKVVEVSKEDK